MNDTKCISFLGEKNLDGIDTICILLAQKLNMSLDVSLIRKKYLSYDEGKTYIEDKDELYWANITHNLGEMADKAGIYEALWRPHRLKEGYNIPEKDHETEWKFEEENPSTAKDIIPLLEKGLADLKERPEYFEQFNSPNGWGTYKHFVPFVENYLKACKEYPDAIISVDR
jgi:hypothetical protein